MTQKKLIVNAMHKRIVIDNPDDVTIQFKNGRQPFSFCLKCQERQMHQLKKTFKVIGRYAQAINETKKLKVADVRVVKPPQNPA